MFTSFLMDSPGIRYIKNLGYQEGREQARQEMVQALFDFIQMRFPHLLELAEKQAQFLTSIEQVREIISGILQARSYREARRLLRNLRKEQEVNEMSLLQHN